MTNSELEQDLSAALAAHGVPGMAWAVIEDGAVVGSYALGVRDQASGAPMTPETIFEAASLSKPLFAYAVLGWTLGGNLDLDKALVDYLDVAWELYVPRLSLINTRHVLSHQTGMPNWRPMMRGEDGEMLHGKLVIEHLPGAHFTYSGEGFEFLQFTIERLTGQPLDTWITAYLLSNLGMTHSSYLWRGDFAADVAVGQHDGQPVPVRQFDKPSSAYSLLTSATDYARFLVELLHPDNPTAAAMFTPHSQLSDYPRLRWGLGIGIQLPASSDNTPVYWHWGGNRGFQSMVLLWREARRGIVMLTNSNTGLAAMQVALAHLGMGDDHPAFDWLLPAERWRADGRAGK